MQLACRYAVIAAFGRMPHENGEGTLERPARTEAGEPFAQRVMTTIDGRDRLTDFLTSGLSSGEVEGLVAWPDGPRLFEHLRNIERPFQLADLPGYLASPGFPPGPWRTRTMQGAPMRHRANTSAPSSWATRRTAFTPEDDEILAGMDHPPLKSPLSSRDFP